MKSPDLNDLITESDPAAKNLLSILSNNNNISKEEYINILKQKILELNQENININLLKDENTKLRKELKLTKEALLKFEYENKTNIPLLQTKIKNLQQENIVLANNLNEKKEMNQKLCEDNKTLLTELNKNIAKISSLSVQEKNFDLLKKNLEEKEKIINELRYELDIKETKLKKLFEDNKNLNGFSQQMNKENNDFITENNLLVNKIQDMKYENEMLLQKNNEAKINNDKMGGNIDTLNLKLNENANIINNLNSIISSLRNQNQKLKDNLDNAVDKCSLLEQKNNYLQKEIADNEQKIQIFETNNKNNEINLKKLFNKNEILFNANNDTILGLRENQKKNDEISSDYQNFKKKIYYVIDNLQKNENLRNLVNDWKKKINDDIMHSDRDNSDINNHIQSSPNSTTLNNNNTLINNSNINKFPSDNIPMLHTGKFTYDMNYINNNYISD